MKDFVKQKNDYLRLIKRNGMRTGLMTSFPRKLKEEWLLYFVKFKSF